MESESLRNLAIVAHIDAGKTTLSERLLFLSNEISSMGEVDDGMATMDFLEEEQKRGITIEAGVASYTWKKSRFTFFDTPGHLDFTSELDVSLLGVEGALLIISATSGIEPQTLEAWNKIRKKSEKNFIQPLLLINKMDLFGLSLSDLLEEVGQSFHMRPFLMTYPWYEDNKLSGVIDILNNVAVAQDDPYSKKINVSEIPAGLQEEIRLHRTTLFDAATEQDPDLTEKVLAGHPVETSEIIQGLQKSLGKGIYLPVYIGSALNSIGIRQVMNGIHFFVPHPKFLDKTPTFEVLRKKYLDDIGEICFCKLGRPISLPMHDVVALYRLHASELVQVQSGVPGEILAVHFTPEGLRKHVKGYQQKPPISASDYQPLLRTRLEVTTAEDFPKVNAIIQKLVANDVSIKLDTDPETGLWVLSTMGEVQLDVFHERLERESRCKIKMGQPEVSFYEKLKKPLKNLQNFTQMGEFTLEIRISLTPAKTWDTITYQNFSSLPDSEYEPVFSSVVNNISRKGVRGLGALRAFRLMIHEIKTKGGVLPPAILKKGLLDCLSLHLKESDVDVYEPLMELFIRVPNEDCGRVIHDMASRGGEVKKLESYHGFSKIICEVPLKALFKYSTLLRSLSKGQGTFYSKYEKHRFYK